MLQENIWTGLLFLIGICIGSPMMGVSATMATLIAILSADFLKFDSSLIDKGLFGFNAALTGVAILLFFKAVFIVWILVALGAFLSTIIQQVFIKYNLQVFTLPFVLTTWLLLFLATFFYPDILQIQEPLPPTSQPSFEFIFKGFGQVIFQNKFLSGVLFFVAVFISSPLAALFGVLGGAITGLMALYASVSPDYVASGLFSFNAVLCAIVFAGNKIADALWAFLSILLSLAFSLLLYHFQIPQLTFPFVAASFIVVSLKRKFANGIH